MNIQKDYLEFKKISKSFPGQIALHDISFSIKKGEIHAILGENGAGKSTLLNLLHGVLPRTSGEIYIDNRFVEFSSAYDAIVNGVIKVHQEINLVPEMSVMENLLLGFEPTMGIFVDRKKMLTETQALLELMKCKFSPEDRVISLNVGDKQMLQILKALRLKAKIISFDEPTSSLTSNEVNTLFKVIRQLQLRGITVIYITHRLEEVYEICDRTTVLRDGGYMGTYEVKETTIDSLINKMVGRSVSSFAKRHNRSKVDRNNVVLRVKNISNAHGSRNISFDLHKGEIIGFYGLVGAKRTETMMSIFGEYPLISGSIEIDGKPVKIYSPSDATQNGIGLVPENRKEQGFVKDLNNNENISLASLNYYEKLIFLEKNKIHKNSKKMGQKVGLTPNDPFFMTVNLSGGNQQKVILAKWLSTNSKILIFDEPTKGIDVGSKSEIYMLLEVLLQEGKSIIMISDELPEIIGMSDRVFVMRDGEITDVFEKDHFDEAKILSSAIGG